MKNKRIQRLLALTSCVAVLAGCGREDPKLLLKDLPETFHLGEVIDLDEYITVQGSSKSFEVTLDDASSDIASVSGHKITLKEEGEIKFTVRIGAVEQAVSVISISEMRDALIKNFAKYDGEYFAYGLNTGDVFAHRKEYAVRTRFDSSNDVYIRNGYVSPQGSDAGYEFYSDAEEHFHANPKIITKESFDKLNVFSADIKGATRAVEGEEEIYTLSSKSMKSFASSVMLASSTKYAYFNENGEEVNATISKVDFTIRDVESEKVALALIYGKVGSKVEFIDALAFSNEPEDFIEDHDVESFVKNPSKFDFGDSSYSLLKSFFTEDIPASGAAIAEFKYGWVNGDGASIPAPSDSVGTYFEGMPIGSSKRILSSDAIVTVVDDEIVSGVIQKTVAEVTTVYDVSLNGENHVIEANPDYADVYENAYESLAFIVDSRSCPFDSFYVSKTEAVEDTYKLTLNPNLKRHYDFMDGVCSCESTISYLVSFLYQYKEREFQRYFDFELTLVTDSTKTHVQSVECSYSLNWETGIYYRVSFECSFDTTHAYDSLISDLFTEVFGS